MVTIRDVARESGFSSTTVSIVLNNAPLARYIPATTKKRIERAAKKLGYRPNLFARSLRSKRSHTVGVMVFDMTDPFCTLVLRGIENSLYQSSFLPILTDVHNERSRFERYLEMLLDRRVEGHRGGQLALPRYQPAGRPGEKQRPRRHHRARTRYRPYQLADRRQRTGRAHGHRAPVLARASQDRLHPRSQGAGRHQPALERDPEFRPHQRPRTGRALDPRSARVPRPDFQLRRRLQADRRTHQAQASLHRHRCL